MKLHYIDNPDKSLSLMDGKIHVEQISNDPDVFMIETQGQFSELEITEAVKSKLDTEPIERWDDTTNKLNWSSRGLFIYRISPTRWIGIRDWVEV